MLHSVEGLDKGHQRTANQRTELKTGGFVAVRVAFIELDTVLLCLITLGVMKYPAVITASVCFELHVVTTLSYMWCLVTMRVRVVQHRKGVPVLK